jgi:hypothetical protein
MKRNVIRCCGANQVPEQNLTLAGVAAPQIGVDQPQICHQVSGIQLHGVFEKLFGIGVSLYRHQSLRLWMQ